MADISNRTCQVVVERAVEVRDAITNETRKTWSTLKTVWASMTPNRGNETIVGNTLESFTVWTIRMDYFDGYDIKAADRIVYAGRYFTILSVIPDDSYHRDTMIKARETDLTEYG